LSKIDLTKPFFYIILDCLNNVVHTLSIIKMRKIFLTLFNLTLFTVNAQSTVFEGKIMDKTTKESIPFANVIALQTAQGVISNEDGVFKFYIPKNVTTIEISSLGYQSEKFEVSKIDSTFTTVFLEIDEIALEEVIVTNKPIATILSGIISHSKTLLDKSVKLETYYREFVKINNKYSKFADGLIDFYLQPKKKDKLETKLIVNQSRAYQLIGANEIEKKGKADLAEMDSFFDIQKAANGFFSYDYIEKNILSKKNEPNYDFELRSKKDQYGNAIEVIYIIPKPNVEEVLLEGKITYDPVNRIVLDIDIKMSEKHKKNVEITNMLLFKYAFYDIQIKQSYKYINGKYIPSYKKTLLDVYIKFGGQMNDRMMSISDLMVTNFDDTITIIPDKNAAFKERNLYPNGMNYKENFWETNNAMPLSENEERILKTLKNN